VVINPFAKTFSIFTDYRGTVKDQSVKKYRTSVDYISSIAGYWYAIDIGSNAAWATDNCIEDE